MSPSFWVCVGGGGGLLELDARLWDKILDVHDDIAVVFKALDRCGIIALALVVNRFNHLVGTHD